MITMHRPSIATIRSCNIGPPNDGQALGRPDSMSKPLIITIDGNILVQHCSKGKPPFDRRTSGLLSAVETFLVTIFGVLVHQSMVKPSDDPVPCRNVSITNRRRHPRTILFEGQSTLRSGVPGLLHWRIGPPCDRKLVRPSGSNDTSPDINDRRRRPRTT